MKKYFLINLIIFIITIVLVTGGCFVLIINNNKAVAQVTEDDSDKDTIPPKIFDINIADISATSSVITWKTDELSDSLLNYGLDKNYGISRDPRFDKLEHKIRLEDLLPGTVYYIRITSSDAVGNQGISSDYSFTTLDKQPTKAGYAENVIETGEGGLSEKILEEGKGGLSEKGLEQILQFIKSTSNEQVLEKIQEQVQSKAEEILKPPTIILDYADVEVGTDYAIITWETDKEANTMVALAKEGQYNAEMEDPYTWKEGEPDETVLDHRVEITGLSPSTVYHFQVSSQSAMGLTGKSTDKTFKTKSVLPEIYNIQITKIEEESATIKFTTNIPCSSIIEYTNLNNNLTKLEGDSTFLTIHSMKLTNLIFDTYYSALIRVESEDGEKAESNPMTFITIRDELAPIVSKVNTESTLYPGNENKIQTIISWATDEPSKCQLFYHQGLVVVSDPSKLQPEEDFTVKHVQVVTNFLPSTVYKFWVVCNDEAENIAKSEDFIMLTPTREESIIDIILKNFESSFGWVKKVGK